MWKLKILYRLLVWMAKVSERCGGRLTRYRIRRDIDRQLTAKGLTEAERIMFWRDALKERTGR